MSKEIMKEFCEHHRIRILNKNKRAHRYHKVNLDYFRDPCDFNMVQQEIFEMSEPLYTVEIAESELENIAAFEVQSFNNMKQSNHYNMFVNLMAQKEHEKFLKEKYPAVKKAYEHYSLILKLANSGEL